MSLTLPNSLLYEGRSRNETLTYAASGASHSSMEGEGGGVLSDVAGGLLMRWIDSRDVGHLTCLPAKWEQILAAVSSFDWMNIFKQSYDFMWWTEHLVTVSYLSVSIEQKMVQK